MRLSLACRHFADSHRCRKMVSHEAEGTHAGVFEPADDDVVVKADIQPFGEYGQTAGEISVGTTWGGPSCGMIMGEYHPSSPEIERAV